MAVIEQCHHYLLILVGKRADETMADYPRLQNILSIADFIAQQTHLGL